MTPMRSRRLLVFSALALLGAFLAAPARAQQGGSSQQQQQPQPPAGNQDSSSSSSSSPSPDEPDDASVDPSTAKHGKKLGKKAPEPAYGDTSTKVVDPNDRSTWDPFDAYHDLDVGNFYKDKGDLDAAIARYKEAIRLKPDFGKPRLLIAEIYEKRGDTQSAVKYYQEYLQVYPSAPDAKKVQKKIEKLESK